jgi:hypothetical protein
VSEGEADLRDVLEMLDPLIRDALRRVLIHDQAGPLRRNASALDYRDGHGDDWADIIDMQTMHPEERRQVVGLSTAVRRGGSTVSHSNQDLERWRS